MDRLGWLNSRLALGGLLVLVALTALYRVEATLSPVPSAQDQARYERITIDLAREGRFVRDGRPTMEVPPLHIAALAAAVTLARLRWAEGGRVTADDLRDTLRRSLAGQVGGAGGGLDVGDIEVVYAEVVDPTTVVPWVGGIPAGSQVLAAVAVFVAGLTGPVRLIDNVLLGDPADEERLLRSLAQEPGR
jgi:hypothetical protein